ncbi:MAG TPA: mersacidin/lichenicidin family type 2 lantibiotic [Ktedonobacteraceae bacterium]
MNMKFDVVRAWKDENYRQTLNKEQLSALPANPAGEINETELAGVCGGDGNGDSAFGASTSALASSSHFHSYGLLCDTNIFSLDVPLLELDHLINIASSETQVCVNAN